jgi:hypothetical protein
VRSEKLLADAGDSLGTQRKGNVHRLKLLPSNGCKDWEDTMCAVVAVIFKVCNPMRLYMYCVPEHYTSSCFCLKHIISETGFSLRLQVEPTDLAWIDGTSPYLRTPAPTQESETVLVICCYVLYVYNTVGPQSPFGVLKNCGAKTNWASHMRFAADPSETLEGFTDLSRHRCGLPW